MAYFLLMIPLKRGDFMILRVFKILMLSATPIFAQDNINILESIPLYKGYEKKERNEAKVADQLGEIFSKIADEAMNADGSINRGTHAKGMCFESQFNIFGKEVVKEAHGYSNEQLERLFKGVFSSQGEYSGIIRFANAKGQRNADTESDVRAVSFSVDFGSLLTTADGSSKLDFMMNSSPMFAVRNISEFHQLMKFARVASGDYSYFPNPTYLPAVLNAKKLLDEYERNDIKSFATESYWTNVPYVHGLKDESPDEIAKYKLSPCSGPERVSESSSGKSASYLQDDILERALNGDICFNFEVQLLNKNKMQKKGSTHRKRSMTDIIENSGELWSAKDHPYFKIAQLKVKKGSEAISCDDVAFNTRLRSSKEHRPIGSLARVRTFVEEKSRQKRMSEN